jgi:hypothetical protein
MLWELRGRRELEFIWRTFEEVFGGTVDWL